MLFRFPQKRGRGRGRGFPPSPPPQTGWLRSIHFNDMSTWKFVSTCTFRWRLIKHFPNPTTQQETAQRNEQTVYKTLNFEPNARQRNNLYSIDAACSNILSTNDGGTNVNLKTKNNQIKLFLDNVKLMLILSILDGLLNNQGTTTTKKQER